MVDYQFLMIAIYLMMPQRNDVFANDEGLRSVEYPSG
jgi:hypothetical protein